MLYYSAEYDSTGKLLSQYENTNVVPNHYFITGILRTKYSYDSAGRCTSMVTTNDSGVCVSQFRCRYNSKGQIELWDTRRMMCSLGTYDSIVYNDFGAPIYVLHHAPPEPRKEHFFEYDNYGKMIRWVEKWDGKIQKEEIYYREKGLLLSVKTIMYYQDRSSSQTSYTRQYEFFD